MHPQSSVRLHKYCVPGRVAGSQVNMTYEYCRSHSLPSCPPQLLMSGLELAQLYLRPFSLLLLKTNEKHRQMDEHKKTMMKKKSAHWTGTYKRGSACWEQNQMRFIFSYCSRNGVWIFFLQCNVPLKEKSSNLRHGHSAQQLQKRSYFKDLYY